MDDRVLGSKVSAAAVFLQIRWASILNVMVESGDDLLRRMDPYGPHRLKLRRNRGGVLMGHAVCGSDANVVAAADELSLGKVDSITLDDLLCESSWREALGRDNCGSKGRSRGREAGG